jgi:hypothetical protein
MNKATMLYVLAQVAVGVGISSHEGALETHRCQEWGQRSRRRTANDQYALSGSVLERHERGMGVALLE